MDLCQQKSQLENRRKEAFAKAEEIRLYFNNEVNPVFQPLIISLAKYRPEDILSYCIKWFKDKKTKTDSESDEEQDNFCEISDEQFLVYRKERLNNNGKHRNGVSAQVYGNFNKRKELRLLKGIKKPEKTHLRILFFISNSFLFWNFSEIEINMLIENMQQKNTEQNQIIIKEGDSGNQMFIVDQGIFQCYHEQDRLENNSPRVLKRYVSGDTFGQLLLLHNNKRAATIVSKKQGRLYSLTRQVYKHFKKMSIVKKKLKYLETLNKIKLFQLLEQDEKQKICDVLVEVQYEAQKFVIIEGDIGNKFYIILEGVLIALKGPEEKMIQCYKEGDYFGQLALINDIPRQASVKTLTKARLVYITQNVFKRIIDKTTINNQMNNRYNKRNILVHKRN